MKEIMPILLILVLACSIAYAEPVNLMANGYDYVLMNDNQRIELIDKLLMIFKQDRAKTKNTIIALDGLYYIYAHEVEDSENKGKAIEAVFSRPVMSVLAELLTMPPPTSYDKGFMKKYGLKLNKEV